MERQAHDYAAAMAYAQQQAASIQQQQQQQQYGFLPQAQQFPHQMPGPPFAPPHPSLQQYPPYPRPLPPQGQLYPHHAPSLLQHQQLGPTPFTSRPPHVMSSPPFMHPFDSAPPPSVPPSDPELQKRIDKLVEYIAKNGPEFEAMIRDKQHDNPDYSFLFGGEGHNYYKYKLWMSTRPPTSPFNPPYPSVSMHMMPPLGATAIPPGSMAGVPPVHQSPFPPFYDPHQQPPKPYVGQVRPNYEPATKSFKGLSGPLPADVAAELLDVLMNLNGTKESIKGAKTWFMQRLPFAPALAEALRERVFALEDSERQLHIIFLANDILFESLQRRTNLGDLDNEALAFKPVLGPMLARIYNNPLNKDENQSRLEKILQFWGSKEVYDQYTIVNLEREMKGGIQVHSAVRHDVLPDHSTGSQQLPPKWQVEKSPDQQEEKQLHPASAPSQFVTPPQFSANQLPTSAYPPVGQSPFPGSLQMQPSVLPSALPQNAASANISDPSPPPYPLFPPGLIPGMVRKMQIGSGVPYSPLSPLDIPTIIPPSTVPESEILERVSKFFKEIGEVNPSEGPMKTRESKDYDDYDRDLPVRVGGACIPPPANLLANPETGMHADGTVDSKPGSSSSGRLGLGAAANPNEVSQYDDVYSSYRKQRSTNYHSSMSARSAPR